MLFILTAASAGCATQTGWAPTVDYMSDPNAYRLQQDYAECRQLALQASGGTVKQGAMGAAAGGLLGAATGAAIGAVSGNPGGGAAIGAAAGGIGGATHQGIGSQEEYKSAYSSCMRQRGHKVIN
jgi:outer membrane lipoprotein SlyB